jgi:hypothetical protein
VHEALAKANFGRDAAFFTSGVAAKLGMTLHENAFPVIDVTVNHKRPIRLKLTARHWDEEPPSVRLLKPDGIDWRDPVPGGVFHQGPHRNTSMPFICMRGVLEYHTHESHTGDVWANYRGQSGMEPVGILMQLAQAWRKANP